MDKVQKIREEVARIQLYTQSEVLKQVLDYIDEVQKEPVSEDLEYASEKYACRFSSSKYGHDKIKVTFIAGAQWQKEQKDSIVSDDLEEAADCYKDTVTPEEVDDSEHAYSYETYTEYQIADAFKDGANWQKEQFEKDYTDLCNGIATAKGLAVIMAYDKGMADAKEQMMKDAVALETEIFLEGGTTLQFKKGEIFLPDNNPKTSKFKAGDKVKLIIIKEG